MIFYEMYDCKRNSFFVKKQNQKNLLKKIFLFILGIIIYIFIGVLYYWTSILINYKKSKTKQSLGCWLSEFSYNNSIDCFMETREQSYFCFSVFWIVTLPFYAVMMLFYHIICLFSNIIKKNSEYQS